MNPKISIIILNYNAGDLLLDCVKSVLDTNYDNMEIIVVDNASTDNSHRACKEKYDIINLIENDKNLGYCEGNNVGLLRATGEFVAILNPDTIVDQQWLKELLSSYNKFGEGLYQPKLLSASNHQIFNSTGNMIQLFGFGYSRGKGDIDKGQFDKDEIVTYSSGACLFTSLETIKKIGLFDPFLFAYHDDLDLGWRALLLGIKSFYIPKSIVYHAESFSFKWSPYKFFLLERNRHYCLWTHYSKTTFYKMLPMLFLVEIGIFFFFLSKGLIVPKIRAYLDIIKNRKQISKRYTELQNTRKIDDKEIIHYFQNEIFVPKEVSAKFTNKLFNNFITILSKSARSSIAKNHEDL